MLKEKLGDLSGSEKLSRCLVFNVLLRTLDLSDPNTGPGHKEPESVVPGWFSTLT